MPGRPALDAASLEEAGLAYLARYSASAAHTRQVLLRRLRRAGITPEEAAEARATVDALIQRWLAAGILDDARFAESKAASLHRRGASARGIAARLSESGVAAAKIAAITGAEAKAQDQTVRPGGDLGAALNLAKRRRMGPYRSGSKVPCSPEKELAAFARAGFGRNVALKILSAKNPEAAEILIREWQESQV